MRKVLSIFQRLENFHLEKDVVKLPGFIAERLNTSCDIIYSGEYIESASKYISFINVRRMSICLLSLPALYYIACNAKKYDVLFLIHLRYYTLIYTLFYKLFNRTGKVYIKLDHGDIQLKELGVFYGNSVKVAFEKILYKLIKNRIDLISAETEIAIAEASKQLDFSRVVKVPNCIDQNSLPIHTKRIKENRILVIGNLFEENKNVKFFLDAMENVNLGEWSVELIGNYDHKIEAKLNWLFTIRPDLRGKINLIGPLHNRVELLTKMLSSRVLCHTAKHEGSPLVFSEAVFTGMIVCTTRVAASSEYTQYGGFIVEQNDLLAYSNKINEIVAMSIDDLDVIHNKLFEKYHTLTWQYMSSFVVGKLGY